MQKMILLTDIFRLRCKTVLQTDFFCNKFRRINNLFGPSSCRLRYFSKDKRKTLWRHKYCYCYRGEGSPAVPWRANTGVGRKGKMKLRFVKFFTSRENEIEKKEEGTAIACSAVTQLGRGKGSRSSSRPPLQLPFSLPPPSPTSPQFPHSPACLPPRVGRVRTSSYPLSSCSASPFLLHKNTKAEERGGMDRGGAPSLPTQLSYSTITWRRPARPRPSGSRLVLHRFRFLPSLGAVRPQRLEP